LLLVFVCVWRDFSRCLILEMVLRCFLVWGYGIFAVFLEKLVGLVQRASDNRS